jgi:hypothetical protein
VNRVNEFFDQLISLTKISDIEKLCVSECEVVALNYSTLASRRKRFTAYRNYLKKFYFKDSIISDAIAEIHKLKKTINSTSPLKDAIIQVAVNKKISLPSLKTKYRLFTKILNNLRLTDFENNQINEDYIKKVNLRRDADNRKYIIDVDGYINKAISELDSIHYMPRVLALAALTGRRIAEIGCTASFKYIDDSHVLFTGQLKTKNDIARQGYIIPVFHNAKSIIESLDKLHLDNPKFLDNPAGFDANYSPNMGKVAKKYNCYVEGDVTAKDLRSIYAPIAYERYCPDKKEHDTLFYTKILGHSEQDVQTCLSYLKYKIQ